MAAWMAAPWGVGLLAAMAVPASGETVLVWGVKLALFALDWRLAICLVLVPELIANLRQRVDGGVDGACPLAD